MYPRGVWEGWASTQHVHVYQYKHVHTHFRENRESKRANFREKHIIKHSFQTTYHPNEVTHPLNTFRKMK